MLKKCRPLDYYLLKLKCKCTSSVLSLLSHYTISHINFKYKKLMKLLVQYLIFIYYEHF